MAGNEQVVRDALGLFRGSEPTDHLYVRLANDAGLGADKINRLAEGKAQFARIWREHGRAVCANPLVRAYIRDPGSSDDTAVALQLADILAVVPGTNVALVAALAFRIGLGQLCSLASGPAGRPDTEPPPGF